MTPPSPAPRAVRVAAPAKINLFLHVGDKRSDGFHDLESLVVFTEAGDALSAADADALSLSVAGPFAGALPVTDDNLVLRAARALGGSRGAAVALEKHLPVASGIGGGSADAAAALRALNVVWGLHRSEAELMEIAATIGSDIPACVLSRPCWMEGRGERISEVGPLPPVAMVLVNPGIAVPTAGIFKALNARSGLGEAKPPAHGLATLWDLTGYLQATGNDLEAPAAANHPEIEHVLSVLSDAYGCVMAQMSGSGATCFGIFEDDAVSRQAAVAISRAHPKWWMKATRVADRDVGAVSATA